MKKGGNVRDGEKGYFNLGLCERGECRRGWIGREESFPGLLKINN